jgi:oxygen-independent coproporphyrinogen III oxidase
MAAVARRMEKVWEWDNRLLDNQAMAFGIYISVPFCKTKCSYCNFASDVFSRAVFERYVERVCGDVARAERITEEMGGKFEKEADSIYLGGGTPTVLASDQLQKMFDAVRSKFLVQSNAEVTVECAPGTLSPEIVDTLVSCGVNRVSLGVQSFVDQEAAAVGRLHKRETVLDDIARLSAAGINNINIDLIAGLPHQTAESWRISLEETIATGAPHVSVYMLEVDEDSRLGRELIAGGTRYHVHFVPNEDATADFYLAAREALNGIGITQYEISNFARLGFESRHNLKYWTRQPYFGFGVDAHSMLLSVPDHGEAVRFSTADSFDTFVAGSAMSRNVISVAGALEESFFLGLRLNRGVDLRRIADGFGCDAVAQVFPTIKQLELDGLLDAAGNVVRLTSRGRLLSNEVFQAFLAPGVLHANQI